MRDPFPPPPLLSQLIAPLANYLSLPTLPLHAHEIALAVIVYQTIFAYLSPLVSTRLFPTKYPRLSARTRLNWDVHVVSLVQSLLVNSLALWVIWTDDERRHMDWRARVWGYTGASGLVQGLAAGYFLWDLCVTARHVTLFGPGMLAHAFCALFVFTCGFRPFVNYYGPVFILYELSSPALNIHWFLDKLDMTGSRLQLYNGILLLTTFFSCRLVWGTWQTIYVTQDVATALFSSPLSSSPPSTSWYLYHHNNKGLDHSLNMDSNITGSNHVHPPAIGSQSMSALEEIMRFVDSDPKVPIWLALMYLFANVLLTCLNFYWFTKMIDAVRKRFTAEDTKVDESENRKAGGSGGDGIVAGLKGKKKQEEVIIGNVNDLDTASIHHPVDGTAFEPRSGTSVEGRGSAADAGGGSSIITTGNGSIPPSITTTKRRPPRHG